MPRLDIHYLLGRSCQRRSTWLALGIGIIWAVTPGAWAQPRTLYKPKDIENARINIERYGWARAIVAGWKKSTAYAMKRDRSFFNQLIPDLTPGSFYGQNCPACVGRQSVMGESGLFDWRVEKPDQVVCEHCGTVYPNDKYPETGVLECPRMGQTFTYYQTPEELANPRKRNELALKWLGNRPEMTSFSGMIRYGKVHWAYGQLLTLAKLYAVTGDLAYAERAAWILDRFARVFPHYLYHSYDGSYADLPPAEVAANMGRHGGGGRFPKEAIRHAYGLNQLKDHSALFNGFWGAGRLSVHGKGSDAGPLLSMIVAYDLILDARHPDGRPLLDASMNRRIREDLIEAGCTDLEHWNGLSNKGVAVFSVLAAAGVLFGEPERFRAALDGLDRIMAERYHFDGFYAESPGYAAHNYSNMEQLPDLLLGYSDPPGYQPATGSRIQNLDPFSAGRVHLALQAMVRMLAPGNRMPAIGDTVYDTRLSPLYAEIMAARCGGQYVGLLESVQGAPLCEKGSEYSLWYRSAGLKTPAGRQVELPLRSEWFPGWHVGVLRGDRKANDTALFLNGNEKMWTIQTGHRQYDILSLSYYAFGKELVSDRGYFSGSGQLTRDGRPGQTWIHNTHSHNLVVVDEDNQQGAQCGSDLELFGAAPGIEIIQASTRNAYPQCNLYRRTTALVRTPNGQTYAVDFFRVRGGKVHQYSFHSNGELTGANPLPSAPQPVKLSPAWNKWLANPRALAADQPRTFTWRSGNVNLDFRLLNHGGGIDRVIVADAPGWRKGSELEKPPVQQILVEHRGNAGKKLATQYAALIVPYQGDHSPVIGASLLENDIESGVLAVEVRLADRTDIIFSSMNQAVRQYGPVKVAGQFAFVSRNAAGRPTQAYLLGGTSLACQDLRIDLPAPDLRLKVGSISGRTIHLDQPLPSGAAETGAFVLASGPQPLASAGRVPMPRTGFDVESTTADTITVRNYPALQCNEVTLLHSKWIALQE